MKAHRLVRRAGESGVVAGMFVLAVSVTAAASGAVYCGGGRGPTAELAIASAIEDATYSAELDGLLNCELANEPVVTHVTNDPYRGDFYRAGVNMNCTP
jgi:hypothetical protein